MLVRDVDCQYALRLKMRQVESKRPFHHQMHRDRIAAESVQDKDIEVLVFTPGQLFFERESCPTIG